MKEIIYYLPILAILVASNILLGTVYNMSVADMKFDKTKFLDGIKKALSVGIAFVGLAYTFDVVPVGGDILTPDLIMTAAIATYAGKVVIKLTEILGVSDTLGKAVITEDDTVEVVEDVEEPSEE